MFKWPFAVVLVVLALSTFGAFALVGSTDLDREELERIAELLDIDPGEVVADVGAGNGEWSIALAEKVGETGRVYATEVDPNDLKDIRKRVEREKAANVSIVEGSQEDTGLPDACCDSILLRRVYHHFQKPDAMRSELREALRDGGLLLVIDFGPNRSWSRPEGIPESRGGHGIGQELLVTEMQQAGFELVREMDWDGNDYALLFRVAVPD